MPVVLQPMIRRTLQRSNQQYATHPHLHV